MDHTEAHSRNTRLKNRVLWYDGDSSYCSDNVVQLITTHNIKYVDDVNNTFVQQYNKNVPKNAELTQKTTCEPISVDWRIPQQALDVDLLSYLVDKHMVLTQHMAVDEAESRDMRLLTEFELYIKHNLTDMLRAIIFVVDQLDKHNVVRGVGRGSSVASYLLYVVGVHDVDSFAYDLDVHEFLHD